MIQFTILIEFNKSIPKLPKKSIRTTSHPKLFIPNNYRLCPLCMGNLTGNQKYYVFHGISVKGQLQRFYKLMSYERAFKMLKNDMCITEIGQAVLEL